MTTRGTTFSLSIYVCLYRHIAATHTLRPDLRGSN